MRQEKRRERKLILRDKLKIIMNGIYYDIYLLRNNSDNYNNVIMLNERLDDYIAIWETLLK